MSDISATFDEFAHGVLQLNAMQLDKEKNRGGRKMKEMEVLSFYFSVKTSACPNVTEMHGSVSTLKCVKLSLLPGMPHKV